MRLAIIAAALALTACGGPPRTIAVHYSKAEVSDSQAAKDKNSIGSMSGVNNVVLEHNRDGTARLQVYILDGDEGKVMPKIDDLGYTRVR